MTTLQQIDLRCPICDTRFRSQAVVSTNSFGGKRTDFHERAAGTQPLPYLIHMCARCGYSGSERDFSDEAEVSPITWTPWRWVCSRCASPNAVLLEADELLRYCAESIRLVKFNRPLDAYGPAVECIGLLKQRGADAIVLACTELGVPVHLVKMVSDNADETAHDWSAAVDGCARELARWLEDFLRR